VNVLVTLEDGRHFASVPFGGEQLPCCTAGHPDPEEAARHAWRLSRAIARKASRAA
jgi:hypothetical protein